MGGHLVRVQPHSALVAAYIPLDRIAALAAGRALATAQQPADTFRIDSQGPAGWGVHTAAVPAPRRGIW